MSTAGGITTQSSANHRHVHRTLSFRPCIVSRCGYLAPRGVQNQTTWTKANPAVQQQQQHLTAGAPRQRRGMVITRAAAAAGASAGHSAAGANARPVLLTLYGDLLHCNTYTTFVTVTVTVTSAERYCYHSESADLAHNSGLQGTHPGLSGWCVHSLWFCWYATWIESA